MRGAEEFPEELKVSKSTEAAAEVPAAPAVLAGGGIDRPIFVVGHPRSGTTLLASMLGRHPEVAATPETLYFLQGRFQLAPVLRAGPEAVAARIHGTTLRRLAPDRDALVAALAAAAPLDGRKVLAVLLGLYAAARGKRRVLEKTPLHIRHIDEILGWFPDARVLWIVRDGRACVASLAKIDWASDDPKTLAWQWVRNIAFAEASERRAGASMLRVRYEDLVTDPTAAMDRVQDFLGIARSAAVHDHTLQAGTIKPFERSWKENVARPIMSRRVDAWKDEIDVAELAAIMNPTLVRLGYPPAADSSGPLARALLSGRRRLTCGAAAIAVARAVYPTVKQLRERLRKPPPRGGR